MNSYSLSHLSDQILLRDLSALVSQDRATTAALLAHIAEVDARRLYLPAACPSMFAYCLRELHLSEECAFKRIHAARTARRFPAIFSALADGRLHLSAVVMLAPYLTQENADELIAAGTHKTKSEIEQLLAQRFPRPDVPTRVRTIVSSLSATQLSPVIAEAPTAQHAPGIVEPPTAQHAPGRVDALAVGPVEAPAPRSKVTPLSPARFALQLTISQSTHEKLRYAQQLLSHQVQSGDIAEVLDRALDALILKLEKRKFAATANPRPRQRRSSSNKRYVPAETKRAVWKRDQGQCTFVSQTGHRCPARSPLEFDHIDEVARGGQATAERMRLRCRAHNQYGAHVRGRVHDAQARSGSTRGGSAGTSTQRVTATLRNRRSRRPSM